MKRKFCAMRFECKRIGKKELVGLPRHRGYKTFSSSAQLSMKFRLAINVEIVKISGKFKFNTQHLIIYPAHKC